MPSTFRHGLFASLLLALTSALAADEVRIATWNVHEGFSPAAIVARQPDFEAAGKAIRPDVLLVQEVTTLATLEAVRDALGLRGYHCAISDFNPNDEPDFANFEVGVISKYPIDQVIEYDATPDNGTKPNAPPELQIQPQLKLGLQRPAEDTRGFLWVKIEQLKLTVAVTHLKSSRGAKSGPDDRMNAVKREFVAAAIAAGVVEDRGNWPDYSCIVGGDLNVGHSDLSKNGTKLDEDFDNSAPGQDGYDETHALFRGGLIGGLKMHNLVGHLRQPTFPAFPSTPIDNLYVTGAGEKQFQPATILNETFGSDHRPVVTVFQTKIYPPQAKPAQSSTATVIKNPLVDPAPVKVPEIVPSAEARKYVDHEGTVELQVQASALLPDRQTCFLNSLVDRTQLESFTVVIFSDGLKSFAAAGIDDPAAHFRGKKIRVTGKIHLRRDTCQIVVDKPSQIKIVP